MFFFFCKLRISQSLFDLVCYFFEPECFQCLKHSFFIYCFLFAR